MSKILIGSPIKQKSEVLKEFLMGLEEADKGSNEVSYYFVDDNTEEKSSELLKAFSETHNVILKKGKEIFDISKENLDENDYDGHNWKSVNLRKVTEYKNEIINYCIREKYDYLFLVDSDIVIDKRTIPQLLSDNVEIVSSVFWTQWSINAGLNPQCFWIPDVYNQFKSFNVPLEPSEANRIKAELVNKLKAPGLYKIDGTGACTLIARSALEKGVNFKEIPNLSIPGEDRHFCIRAGALGIDLYVDTVYPVYHIFREEYLSRVDEFKRDGFKFDMCQIFEEEPEENVNQGIICRIKMRLSSFLKRICRALDR